MFRNLFLEEVSVLLKGPHLSFESNRIETSSVTELPCDWLIILVFKKTGLYVPNVIKVNNEMIDSNRFLVKILSFSGYIQANLPYL